MQILFIIDPLPTLKAYKDSSVAMMQALAAREHALSIALPADLYMDMGEVKARATRITLKANADLHGADWYAAGQTSEMCLGAFDAVLMRKDPPFDMEYFYTAHLLHHASQQGAKVFNSGQAIVTHPEKLAIAEFPQFTPPTLVSRDMTRLRAFYEHWRSQQQDVIVKPLDGMGGMGIFRLQQHEPNLGAILETLTDNGQRTIMAQRYIPDIVKGDKRILLIAGQPIPYALARIPLAGETRGNLAAGGRGVAQPLSERDQHIAHAVGTALAPRGLLLIGLDVIGDYLTEINVTSPTCFVEITQQTDFNVADAYAQALQSAVQG